MHCFISRWDIWNRKDMTWTNQDPKLLQLPALSLQFLPTNFFWNIRICLSHVLLQLCECAYFKMAFGSLILCYNKTKTKITKRKFQISQTKKLDEYSRLFIPLPLPRYTEALEGPSLFDLSWFLALKCGYDSIVLCMPSCKKNYSPLIKHEEHPLQEVELTYILIAKCKNLCARSIVHFRITSHTWFLSLFR